MSSTPVRRRPLPRSCLLVGLGARAGKTLVPALADPAVPLLVRAVCDPDHAAEARLRDLAGAGLVPPDACVYRTLDEALAVMGPTGDPRSGPVAVVATPHADHLAAVLALAAAGVPVLKEKPFALDRTEADRLMPHALAGGVRVLTHRSHSLVQEVVGDLLHRHGPVVSYRLRLTRSTGDYAATWRGSFDRAGGGVVLDLGYHALDLIARMAPPPTSVFAAAAPSPATRAAVPVEETAHLIIEHAGVTAGSVYLSRCDARGDEVSLVTADGTTVMLTPGRAVVTVTECGGTTHRMDLTTTEDPVVRMLVHHLATLDDPVVSAAETMVALRATALADAARTSLRTGTPAPVPPEPTLPGGTAVPAPTRPMAGAA